MTQLVRQFTSLVAALLLAGCSSEPVTREDQQAEAFADLRLAVTETVTDEARRGSVLEIVNSLESDVNELRALLIRRRTELRELNADYDATRESFVRFTREMEERIQQGRRRALEQHQKLVGTLSDEEWDSLARAETRAMKSVARSIQGI